MPFVIGAGARLGRIVIRVSPSGSAALFGNTERRAEQHTPEKAITLWVYVNTLPAAIGFGLRQDRCKAKMTSRKTKRGARGRPRYI